MEREKPIYFSKKEIDRTLEIWRYASISLKDIRYGQLSLKESVLDYVLPANGFIFTYGGKVEVLLDESSFCAERFGVFHGGKGAKLSIYPMTEWLEYYLVLYKEQTSFFAQKRYLKNLMKDSNPFLQKYGFGPQNPIYLLELFKKMHENWKMPTPLVLLYEKTIFYQLVYEIYREIEQGDILVLQPDIGEMAKRYLDEHFKDSILITDLAKRLGVSTRQLTRIFKQKTGKSTQDYLIARRLEAATKCLKDDKLTLREIALFVGFRDEFYFSRVFKTRYQISPIEYRRIYACRMSDLSMENIITFPYNEECLVSLDELKEKGAASMIKQIRSKAFVAAALSLMLMLSACGTTPQNTTTGEASSTANVISQTENEQKVESVKEETKIIHMDYGDVEIPANPQRVVVIFVQGDVLALGVTPIATSFNDDAAFLDQAKEVTIIDAFSINEEEIMALDPDLILWNSKDEAVYESLSKIAPTLANDYYSMDYKDRLRFFGDVLNRSEEAEELIVAFETKIADAKKQFEDKGLQGKSVLCIQDRKQGILSASWLGRGGPLMYDLLGFQPPEKIKEIMNDPQYAKNGSVELSGELLMDYASDYILMNGPLSGLEKGEIWKSLPAVKENHVIEVPSNLFWYNDIISMNAQVDIILDSILGNNS